mgnify:FL=1
MNIIHLDEVNSTNLYAKQNLEILSDRTIVIADKQTNGRGRFDRTWIDLGEGNLFMTIILKPSSSFNEVYANLTQYLSVVLAKILEEYGLSPKIKWPNDVMVNDAKISGILSETVMQGSNFKGIVLGIGVNLNADKGDLKQIKERVATALNIELNREYIDKKLFTEKLLNEFFKNYEEFLKLGFSMIKKEYVQKCNFLNKEISVQVFNKKKSGIAKRINDNGELVLEKNNIEFILTMGDIL